MKEHSLPDVVHVGLKRAGSTLLRELYEQHPQISWSRKGYYFLLNRLFESDDYAEHLGVEDRGKVHVDMSEHLATGMILKDEDRFREERFSVDVNAWDEFAELNVGLVARRIQERVPTTKVLLVLREPIDWLRCHYRNFMRHLPRGRNTFLDFCSTFEGKLVLGACRFAETVETYFDLFGEDRVLVLFLEDMRDDLDAQVHAVCDFFGVDNISFNPSAEKYHRGATNVDVALRRVIGGNRRIGDIARATLGRLPMARKLRREMNRAFGRDPIPNADQRMMKSLFASSNARLSKLVNRDLSLLGYNV